MWLYGASVHALCLILFIGENPFERLLSAAQYRERDYQS